MRFGSTSTLIKLREKGIQWKFNSAPEQWESAGTMAHARWYPTTITLGDDSGRVLVAGGSTSSNFETPVPEMEIYEESSNSFTPVWGPAGPEDTLFYVIPCGTHYSLF